MRTLPALLVCLVLCLAGCSSDPPERASGGATGRSAPSPRPGDLPTGAPPTDSGALGPGVRHGAGSPGAAPPGTGPRAGTSTGAPSAPGVGGDHRHRHGGGHGTGHGTGNGSGQGTGNGSGQGTGQGSGPGAGGGDDDRSIEVAGPTLGDDYPEYFGNIYPGGLSKCAYFVNDLSYDVRVDAVAVGAPLRVLNGCTPDSREHPADPGCSVGRVLAASHAGGCSAGVTFASGTDLGRNYTPSMTWRLSVSCTDTAAPPCSTPSVVAAGPAPDHPVRARWSSSISLRFCGATDYADDDGNPGGTGYPPSDGCSDQAPATDDPSDDPSQDPSGDPSATTTATATAGTGGDQG